MAPTSLPPGFRFHPTDEELVDYYLKRKVHGEKIELEVIPEIDLYKCEPWDLPEKSFFPSSDMEWYFFNLRDKKYPNGLRTNRATEAGYWKATGKDRKVSSHMHYIGMKKTLVFYRGRAPHGSRTNWIMHEYRLDEKQCQDSAYLQDAYSLCRVFKRSGPDPKYGKQHDEISNLYNKIYTVPQELSSVKFEEIDQRNSLIPPDSSSEMMSDNAVANGWLHFGADETESCNIYQSPNEFTSRHPNVEKKSGFEYEHSVAVPSEIEGLARFLEQYNSSAVEEEDMVEQIYRHAQLSQENIYANQLDDFYSERSLESYDKKPNRAQEQENDLCPLCIQDLQGNNLVGLLDMEKQPPFF